MMWWRWLRAFSAAADPIRKHSLGKIVWGTQRPVAWRPGKQTVRREDSDREKEVMEEEAEKKKERNVDECPTKKTSIEEVVR